MAEVQSINNPGLAAGRQLKASLGQGWSRWQGLSRHHRQVLLLSLLASVIAVAVVGLLWQSGRSYVPLYGKQELYDKGSIVEALEAGKIDFRLDPQSGEILVEPGLLGQARMLLASRGIKAVLPTGLDGLAQHTGLGTSQFMETRRYRHALEGELARTIMALDWVRNARVHLAVPERTLFIGRAEQTPTASVMLDIIPGRQPDPSQVEGIVNLVAGSVPGMENNKVSVIDQGGQLLSDHLAADGLSRGLSLRQVELTRQLEQQLTQRARDMLYPVLGANNFRVQVTAELDFNAVEETRETLDQSPVLLRESGSENNSQDSLGLGIPGALANVPPQTGEDAEGDKQPNQNLRERREFQRQFESGRSVVHTRYQTGRLSQLSVSVLLNNGVAPEGGWQQAQLEQLGQMVQGAVGFNGARGDQFALTSFDFTPQAVLTEFPPEPQWWQSPEWQDYARYLAAGLMLLALLLFGVRPLVRHLNGRQLAAAGQEEDVLVAGSPAPALSREPGRLAVAGQESSSPGKAGPHTLLPWEMDEREWQLPPPGSELKVQVAHLQILAERETDRVAEVIKHWIKDHD
ncbi:flagellar M-ring protein FliF [Zobellella denitrificans]|uniref:flagellar basal-body MS-ring/collar protein FliF n=1 Tax=Zobellella denitrificans TaxID=347534 RepID=UPI000B8BCD59|nr:flagellar basal-body MS-ring/collar protein FliF [Zobellella denitrificans]OXS13744.1 flagellar M-ring protein FliF [Zobellella denitrificans]